MDPPVPIALKASLCEAFHKASMSQRHLASDLGMAESEVRRMLNPIGRVTQLQKPPRTAVRGC